MKKITLLISILFMLACSTALAEGSVDATVVGIIPFGYSDDNSRWIGDKLGDFLLDNLESSPEFTIISENDLKDAFDDIGFDSSQFRYGVPPDMIGEAGIAMGADLMIFGFIVPGGGDQYQVMWNLVVVSSNNTITPPPSMVQKNTDPVKDLAETIVSEINNHVGARAEESLNMARYHSSNSNWGSAISSYHQVLDVDPENAEALTELAVIYLKSDVDSVAKAEEIYNKLLVINPQNSIAIAGLGSVALRNEEYEVAKDYYNQAIEADPDNTAAYSGLANAYTSLGLIEEAIESFESALAANPNNLQARYALGLLFVEMENYTEAIPHLVAILDVHPEYTNLRLKLAAAYSEIGNYSAAADNAIIVLEATPDDTSLALFVAQYEAKAGRTTDAANRLNAIIAGTGSRQAYLLLATVYRDSGQRSNMQNVFNRLHSAYPGDPVANYMVGAFYYQSGSSKAGVSELVSSNVSTWQSAISDLTSAISFLNQVTGYRSSQAQNMVAAAQNAISLCEEKIDRVNRYSE